MNPVPPVPGRRIAVRTGGRLGRSLTAAVLLVVLAVLCLLAVRPADVVGPLARAATGAAVTHTLLGCPGGAGDATALDLTAVALPGLGIEGTVRQAEPRAEPRAVRLDRGTPVSLPHAGSARVVEGDGGLAAGLFAVRTDRSRGATALAPCAAPSADWWFTGAGASLDHTGELVLANLDPGPAVVDVRLLGSDGEVQSVGTRGMTLAPGEERRIPLTDVAPTAEELTVGVHASRGRVVGFVSDAFAERAGRPGLEWLPAAVGPSRTVRLAGLPSGAERRTLVVANPGDREAVVSVEVAGATGAFAPAGVEQLSVPPASVQTVDLTKALDTDEPVAVRLRSPMPVLATVRSGVPADSAYAATVSPLDGPAAAPAGPGSTVVLTAGPLGGRATVTAYDDRGDTVADKDLTIPPRASGSWRPPRRAAYVLVRPADEPGPVHGAVSYTDRGLATFPLSALSLRVQEPVVQPALR